MTAFQSHGFVSTQSFPLPFMHWNVSSGDEMNRIIRSYSSFNSEVPAYVVLV